MLIQTLVHILILADESSFLIEVLVRIYIVVKSTYNYNISIIRPNYDLLLKDNNGLGQAISVPKLKELKNEHLHVGSCICSSGPGQHGVSHGDGTGEQRREMERGKNVLWLTLGAF